jgi:hypothetical protein
MKTIRLAGEGGSIDLERSELGPPDTPADEDVLLNVSVHARGYSALDQAWVVGSDWEVFLEQLAEVERTRRGRARVEGASPDDLALEIFSTDSAGHFAIRGHVGRTSPDGHRQRLEFAFAFEPDRLPSLVEELRELADPTSGRA